MRYLRIRNWEKYQQQTTKRLPWIKLSTELLEPTRQPDYAALPDIAKAVLHHLWLMASVFANRIPEDWLTRDRLNLKSKLDLNPLLSSGHVYFELEDGSISNLSRARIARSGFSPSPPLGSPDEEPGFCQESAFDAIWPDYPRRIGRKDAWKHFRATVKTAEDLALIRRALENYKAFAKGRDMQYVQHGKTWFYQWQDWIEPPDGASSTTLSDPTVIIRAFLDESRFYLRHPDVPWPYDFTRDELTAYIKHIAPDGSLITNPVLFDEWRAKQKVSA